MSEKEENKNNQEGQIKEQSEGKKEDPQQQPQQQEPQKEQQIKETTEKPKQGIFAQISKSVLSTVLGSSSEKNPNALKTMSEDRNSKDSAILQVCMERKKESFNQLKEWDEKRTAFLQTHKNIIDGMLFKIEKRMKISQDSMTQIVKFFKERKEQESSYSKVFSTKVPHIGHCWKDVGEQQSDWYPVLSQALKETDDVNESQSKNVLNLVLYIEKNIIKDLLFHENEEFEKKIKLLRNNVSDQQSKLEKAVQYTGKKNNSYNQLYTMMMGLDATDPKLRKKKKDLLNVEIKFRQAVYSQIMEQKELGSIILHYWLESIKMETNRLELIQRVFQLYIAKHQETYGQHPLMVQSLENFNKFEFVKETGENFNIVKIINDEDQSTMKKINNSSGTLTWEGVQQYVVNFSIKDISISQHPLVQKKYKIMRDVGSVTKSFKECWMIATVDDLLLFYDEAEQKENQKDKEKIKKIDQTEVGSKGNEPKRIFLLDRVKLKPREDPQLIDVIEKTSGLIFNSTNKQLIKFIKEDDIEEFNVFLTRYQSGIIEGVPDLGLKSEKK